MHQRGFTIRRRAAGAALVLLPLLVSTASRAAGQAVPRVAVVIGNAAYADAALDNPGNDAAAMSALLRQLGFEVVELRDGTRAQMLGAVDRAAGLLKGRQGVGLLYYAGHAVQIDARNFLLPVRPRLHSEADVRTQGLEVAQVVDVLRRSPTRLNVVVLDACRDNPFGSMSSGRGLAPLDAPSGTFLAYATAPGNVAVDGLGGSRHGLYTEQLLRELPRPGTRIEDVFKRVRFAVRKASNGRQIPWESTSLEEDIYLADGRIVALVSPSPQQLRASYATEAAEWARIKNSRRPDDFYAFLQRHPSGVLAEAAHARLNQLSQPTLLVQGAGADRREQRYVVAGFVQGDVYEQRITTSGGPIVQDYKATARVVKVSGDRVEVLVEQQVTGPGGRPVQNLYIFDGTGGLMAIEGLTEIDPPQRPSPGGLLQVGQQWSVASRTQALSLAGEPALMAATARVVARERIDVDGRALDTFRIEQSGTVTLPGGAQQPTSSVYWMASGWALPLKTQTLTPLPGGGTLTTTVEVLKLKRGG
jgi:hypothetical protein